MRIGRQEQEGDVPRMQDMQEHILGQAIPHSARRYAEKCIPECGPCQNVFGICLGNDGMRSGNASTCSGHVNMRACDVAVVTWQ